MKSLSKLGLIRVGVEEISSLIYFNLAFAHLCPRKGHVLLQHGSNGFNHGSKSRNESNDKVDYAKETLQSFLNIWN